MNNKLASFVTSALAVSVLPVLVALAPAAHAGATIKFGENKSISIGGGLRTSYESKENAAPNGTDRSNEFELESIRLYVNGQVHENIKFTFNTERQANSELRVLDGIAQFEFSDMFNIWMGRLLPPSDRSNLDGPYYLATWEFPLVQKYPALFAGRDDGIAVWGQQDGGKFKYQVGAFQGRDGGSNQADNLLYAGRLTFNFWDPEPGYYNSSTYFGAKDVLAVGVVLMSQDDGAGTAATPGDFTGWNVDVLMEKKLNNGGVLTVEGAFYDYDLDGVTDASLTQGDGYFVLAGYLIPKKIGPGRFQPHIRIQEFDATGTGKTDRTDIGFTYVIDGHNARITVIFADEDGPGSSSTTDFNTFKVGVQLQL